MGCSPANSPPAKPKMAEVVDSLSLSFDRDPLGTFQRRKAPSFPGRLDLSEKRHAVPHMRDIEHRMSASLLDRVEAYVPHLVYICPTPPRPPCLPCSLTF
jgi:hypothetical protein